MDMTEHLCTTTEAHDRFITHTANTIVAIAESLHPGDPVAAAELALRAAGWREGEVSVRLRQEPMRPMDTSDIDPETGEEFGVVPDGQVWVEVTSTRDTDGKMAFTAYWPNGQANYVSRMGDFMNACPQEVKVMTARQARDFHSARGVA